MRTRPSAGSSAFLTKPFATNGVRLRFRVVGSIAKTRRLPESIVRSRNIGALQTGEKTKVVDRQSCALKRMVIKLGHSASGYGEWLGACADMCIP
jgi:hypothetical protein